MSHFPSLDGLKVLRIGFSSRSPCVSLCPSHALSLFSTIFFYAGKKGRTFLIFLFFSARVDPLLFTYIHPAFFQKRWVLWKLVYNLAHVYWRERNAWDLSTLSLNSGSTSYKLYEFEMSHNLFGLHASFWEMRLIISSLL